MLYRQGSGGRGSRRGNYRQAGSPAGMKVGPTGFLHMDTEETKLTTAFNKRIEIWAAIVLIPAVFVVAGCTRTTSPAGAPRPPAVQGGPVAPSGLPVYP